MEIFDDFSKSEPESVVVVYTNENRDLVVKTNQGRLMIIGMLEAAKFLVIGPPQEQLD